MARADIIEHFEVTLKISKLEAQVIHALVGKVATDSPSGLAAEAIFDALHKSGKFKINEIDVAGNATIYLKESK